jgi:hypothetical protein
VGQKTLTRATLLVGVDNANPEQDPAGLSLILEVSGVPGNEPKTESTFEVNAPCHRAKRHRDHRPSRRSGGNRRARDHRRQKYPNLKVLAVLAVLFAGNAICHAKLVF